MNKGFLKIIVLLIVVIIILSLFKIRINAIFDNQFVKENFGFIWDMMKSGWEKYLADYLNGPIDYLQALYKDVIDRFTNPLYKIV